MRAKKTFVDSIRTIIALDEWKYLADRKGAEIIEMILKESTE